MNKAEKISKGDYKDAKEKAKEAYALAKKAFEVAAPKFAEETKGDISESEQEHSTSSCQIKRN